MNKQTLSSISCKVSNCTHYSQGKCEASHINVQGAGNATQTPVNTKQETCCDTFKSAQ